MKTNLQKQMKSYASVVQKSYATVLAPKKVEKVVRKAKRFNPESGMLSFMDLPSAKI